MKKEEIIELYIKDLSAHVVQSEARDNRIQMLEQELVSQEPRNEQPKESVEGLSMRKNISKYVDSFGEKNEYSRKKVIWMIQDFSEDLLTEYAQSKEERVIGDEEYYYLFEKEEGLWLKDGTVTELTNDPVKAARLKDKFEAEIFCSSEKMKDFKVTEHLYIDIQPN